MSLTQNLFCLLAAAILVALFAAPGTALAHSGHSHASQISIDAGSGETSATPDVVHARNNIQSVSAHVISAADNSKDRNCVNGCCSGMSGMACCSVALIPAPVEAPPLLRSAVFTPLDNRMAHGLTPEALPKPPKSIA